MSPFGEPLQPNEIVISLGDIVGPSAGLMFALAVVDKLTPGDLTGGRFIAGTGEITPSGEVRPIGGIPWKLRAARDAGATVFLVPAENCAEAREKAPDGLELVKVATLAEAVAGLEALNDGRTPVAADPSAGPPPGRPAHPRRPCPRMSGLIRRSWRGIGGTSPLIRVGGEGRQPCSVRSSASTTFGARSGRSMSSSDAVRVVRRAPHPQHAAVVAVAQHGDHEPGLPPVGMPLRRVHGQLGDPVVRPRRAPPRRPRRPVRPPRRAAAPRSPGPARTRRRSPASRSRPAHRARPRRQRLLGHRCQPRRDVDLAGELRLGREQVSGRHQGEQLRRLVPAARARNSSTSCSATGSSWAGLGGRPRVGFNSGHRAQSSHPIGNLCGRP